MDRLNDERRLKKKRQVEALRNIYCQFEFKSLAEMAREVNISTATLSRAMDGSKPTLMLAATRLAVARFLGRHCTSEEQLTGVLAETGWELTDEEWDEAVQYMQRKRVFYGMPQRVEGRFVGRQQEIADLKARLLARRKALPRIIIVQGIPGVGKTRLVMQVLREEKEVQEYFRDGIFWLRVEDWGEEKAIMELVEMVLGDKGLGERDPWKAATKALSRKQALIVLDGVNEWIDLNRWAEVVQDGVLLVTTWRNDLGERDQLLHVEPMGIQESLDLLTRDLEKVDVEEADLDWVIEAIGGLPLALYILNRIAWWEKGFGQLVRTLRRQLLPSLEIVEKKGQSVRIAFDLSYEQLDEAAKALFRFVGGFPQPFIVDAVAYVLGWEPEKVGRAFLTLVRVGLVDGEEPGRYWMHRLLHEYAAERAMELDAEFFPQWEERFAAYYLDVTRRAWEKWHQGDDREAFQTWRENLVYIVRGCEYASNRGRGDWVLDYLICTGSYLAVNLMEPLIEKWWKQVQTLVRDPYRLALGTLQVGECFLDMGKPEKAITLARDARVAFQQADSTREWVSAALIESQALLMLGQVDESRRLLLGEEFSERVARLPEDDLQWAAVWDMRGAVEQAIGRNPAALHHRVQALEVLEGMAHGRALWQRAVLGLKIADILMQTDPRDALRFLERGMKAAEEGGYRWLWLANALSRVIVLAKIGRVQDAVAALNETEAYAGKDPRLLPLLHTARAEVAWEEGRWDEAEREYMAAAEGYAGSFNEPEVWDILGERLKQRGDGERAVEMWEKARESALRVGNRHRYVVATFHLGEWLWGGERYAEARPLLEEVAEKALQMEDFFLAADACEVLGLKERAEKWRVEGHIAERILQYPVWLSVGGLSAPGVLGIHTEEGWVWVPQVWLDGTSFDKLASRLLPLTPREEEDEKKPDPTDSPPDGKM